MEEDQGGRGGMYLTYFPEFVQLQEEVDGTLLYGMVLNPSRHGGALARDGKT